MGYDGNDEMKWDLKWMAVPKAENVFWSPLLKWFIAGLVVVVVSAGLIVYGIAMVEGAILE